MRTRQCLASGTSYLFDAHGGAGPLNAALLKCRITVINLSTSCHSWTLAISDHFVSLARACGVRGDETNFARAPFPGLGHRRTAPAENLCGFWACGGAAAFTGPIRPFSLFGRLCPSLRSTRALSPYLSCDASTSPYAGSSMTTNTHSTRRCWSTCLLLLPTTWA